MDEAILQKLAAASTPEEVQACLAEKGLELVQAGPPKDGPPSPPGDGPPKDTKNSGPPTTPKEGAPPEADKPEDGAPMHKLSMGGLEKTAQKAMNSNAQKPPRKRGFGGY